MFPRANPSVNPFITSKSFGTSTTFPVWSINSFVPLRLTRATSSEKSSTHSNCGSITTLPERSMKPNFLSLKMRNKRALLVSLVGLDTVLRLQISSTGRCGESETDSETNKLQAFILPRRQPGRYALDTKSDESDQVCLASRVYDYSLRNELQPLS